MKTLNDMPFPILCNTCQTGNIRHELWRVWWPENLKPGPDRLHGMYKSEDNARAAIAKEMGTCRFCGAPLGEKYLYRLNATVPYCRECGESHE